MHIVRPLARPRLSTVLGLWLAGSCGACAESPEPVDTGIACETLSGVAGLGDLTSAGFTGTGVLDEVGAEAAASLVWDDGSTTEVTTHVVADSTTVEFSTETCEDGTGWQRLVIDVVLTVSTADGRLDEENDAQLVATEHDQAEVVVTAPAAGLGGSLVDAADSCEDCEPAELLLEVWLSTAQTAGTASLSAVDSASGGDGQVVTLAEGDWGLNR